MHFVTGGAFNGKRSWVNRKYPEATWISSYKGENLQRDDHDVTSSVIVLEGVEYWLKELISEIGYAQVRKFVQEVFEMWYEWESADSNRNLIIIGTDITKGVVPIEKIERDWRDVTGWVYQDISVVAKRVDTIWYGLNQTIKDEGMQK